MFFMRGGSRLGWAGGFQVGLKNLGRGQPKKLGGLTLGDPRHLAKTPRPDQNQPMATPTDSHHDNHGKWECGPKVGFYQNR